VKADRRRPPVLVDFHNAPEAFLPEDFELQPKAEAKNRRLFNRAAIAEYSLKAAASRLSLNAAMRCETSPNAPPLRSSPSPSPLPKKIPSSPVKPSGSEHLKPEPELKKAISFQEKAVFITQDTAKATAGSPTAKCPLKAKSKLFRLFNLKADSA